MLRNRGFSLIEVLVTLVIVAVGLLGMAALQARLQLSEMEAYQRTQALLLLQDMTDRINANRANASVYVTGTSAPIGTGDSEPASCAALTDRQAIDACEWSNAIKGAAEKSGTSAIGAMVGGRGCVESIGTDEYLVTVAWQGLAPISAPSAGCGANLYDGAAGTSCVSDLCRRAVTAVIRIGDLD